MGARAGLGSGCGSLRPRSIRSGHGPRTRRRRGPGRRRRAGLRRGRGGFGPDRPRSCRLRRPPRAPPRGSRVRPGTRRAVRRRTPPGGSSVCRPGSAKPWPSGAPRPGGVGSPVPVVVLAALRVFAPGGVELVMSPQLASCQAGSRESSADGFRRAELARREAGWIVLRRARITQAGPGWRMSGRAPVTGQPPPGTNARPAPVRESARGRRGPGPRPIPPRPHRAHRAHRPTREHVT